MDQESNSPEKLSGDTKIWRYMDVPKFVAMLATGMLWFSKATNFHDDPFEGFCQATALRIPWANERPKVLKKTDIHGTRMISLAQVLEEFSQTAAEICERAREYLQVNSWCLGQESMAMWEIYGLRGRGVAISSSINQYLRAAKFGDDLAGQYHGGPVTYHNDLQSAAAVQPDFSSVIPTKGPSLWKQVLELGFHKRSAYSYEREWRAAVYQDLRPEAVPGIYIGFDLNELISAVHVGPKAEPFLVEVVESIMEKYEMRKPLERSTLLIPPKINSARG